MLDRKASVGRLTCTQASVPDSWPTPHDDQSHVMLINKSCRTARQKNARHSEFGSRTVGNSQPAENLFFSSVFSAFSMSWSFDYGDVSNLEHTAGPETRRTHKDNKMNKVNDP